MVESLQEEVEPLGIRTLLIEPGMFRTSLLSPGNLHTNQSQIDDYKEVFNGLQKVWVQFNNNQRGDTTKAVAIIMDVVRNEGVFAADQVERNGGPVKLRLPLGPDAYEAMKKKCEDTLQLLSRWESVIKSTDIVE